jgi:RNA polymerase sigma factor (sigma-70 family)
MPTADTNRRISAWFRQWRSPLRRFLGRSGVRAADADDIAQEVFLRLMRYDKIELIDHPQAYLHKVASNVAAEWAIRAHNRQPHEHRWVEGLIDERHAESVLLAAQTREQVMRALNALTPRQREILKLFFSDGLSYVQISERLGESLRSIRRQFEKSYESLRQELDPDVLGEFTHGRE